MQAYGGDEFVEDVAAHISGESDAPTASLVSSQLDADRLDYVLRDGYYAGIPNASYDVDRIVQLVSFHEQGVEFDDRSRVAIESYIIARYHLYLQLYYHKTNRAAEVLLRSVLRRAKPLASGGEKLAVSAQLLDLFGSASAEASARLNDHDLWSAFSAWRRHDDKVLSDLSRRLLDRDLFKAVEVETRYLADFHLTMPRVFEVVRAAHYDPEFYAVVDTAADTPYKIVDVTAGDNPGTSIRMVGSADRRYSLETKSGLIQQLQHEAYQKVRVCVPAECRDAVNAIFNA